MRDEVVDYIRYWSDKTGIKATKMIQWIGIHRSKYYDWASRYGKVNEHNAWIPRDFWLADWEKSHMTMLAELDKEIKEKIWYDNSFWPL